MLEWGTAVHKIRTGKGMLETLEVRRDAVLFYFGGGMLFYVEWLLSRAY